MSEKRSLPRNLYVGRARVREGRESERGRPWEAYTAYDMEAFWLFREQLLRPCSVWTFRDIYILPVEVEE